ncbi:MAG: cysteine hydrolase family protein [Thermoplasmatota archaeon]
MGRTSFLCVDLQNDFASPKGRYYRPRESVRFDIEVLFPWMEEKKVGCAEIVSDYRQPRRGDPRDCCRPGEWGFHSLLPDSVRKGAPWIKSMNSPLWTRENAGRPDVGPGPPYPDTDGFDGWLVENLGRPDDTERVHVFGLTADCCVLCTVQELRFRGYEPVVISDATDVRSGDPKEKELFLSRPPFTYWGRSETFNELLHP